MERRGRRGPANRAVENIPNASQSVRAALADLGGPPACFDGVALYAD